MTLLHGVKDEIAEKYGYEDWHQLMVEDFPSDYLHEVAIAYAKEALKDKSDMLRKELYQLKNKES